MEVTVDVTLSDQAKTLLDKMPDVKEADFTDWVLSQGITLGGGRVIDYVEYLKTKVN